MLSCPPHFWPAALTFWAALGVILATLLVAGLCDLSFWWHGIPTISEYLRHHPDTFFGLVAVVLILLTLLTLLTSHLFHHFPF
jgi:hypothetical protein